VCGIFFIRQQRFRFKQHHEITERKWKLAAFELENAKLREEEFKKSLVFKNKELTSYTINFIQKNELIESIRQQLDNLKKIIPVEELKGINTLIRKSASVDNDWEDFKRTFENVHHNFFGKLLDQYPDLTPAELRLCALICLNLSIKEMASLMGISADSVKTARYRLRKKFNLEQDQNLTDFVIGFG
jgi:DNA-binding CsgD family transcriptional regulator